jgi:hypothetical protein
MAVAKIPLTRFKDSRIEVLVDKTDKKILARWAIECDERVMPFFEKKYKSDNRPRNAINALKDWISTGKFSMKVIRKASLDSHAAARAAEEDSPAKSAARAAGQAVATAHVARHAYGPAVYAQQAVWRATSSEAAVKKERDWRYRQLMRYSKKKGI